MATIPGVSDGELIRTSWGDAVANELNGNVVKKTGAASQSVAGNVTVGGELTVSDTIRANNFVVLQDGATSVDHAVRKDYVDNINSTLATSIGTRVATAGDTMTGLLTINPASNNCIRLQGSAPVVDWWTETGSDRMAAISASASAMAITSDGTAITFATSAAERMRVAGGILLVGKTASGVATQGLELMGDVGEVVSTVTTNIPNVHLEKRGSAVVDGGDYIRFANDGSTKGQIEWDTATAKVVYAQTSDYRLKNDLGPVTDGAERVMALRPRRITRKDSPAPIEHDAFIAHEVAEVMPSVVSGVKDAVAGPPPEGEPPENYPAEGDIIPQTLDYTGLITVTIAALQDALIKIDELQARVDALEAA